MLKIEKNGINAKKRFVYEISGINPDPGIISISHRQMIKKKWDFILSCHVIEHHPDPRSYVKNLVELGHKGTIFFVELPNEVWKSTPLNKTILQFNWLNWISKKPTLLKLLHFISIIFKLKLKFIPPLLFPALNEHLSFFTINGLKNLLENSGLIVNSCYVSKTGHIIAIAIKE
jgi:hypothetical protein